jgi:hypothetical protein
MSDKTLDEKIFEEFVTNVRTKNILSKDSFEDLKKLISKQNISEEDWGLLVDKDCFPPKKDK